MRDYKVILFDLDGTLTDSAEGITNSVAYALEKFNIKTEDKTTLQTFIGPPLVDSFKKYYGFTDDKAKEAVAYYREYYKDKGLYENKVYTGIDTVLKELYNSGKVLAVATSKPEMFAKQILDYFDLSKYFKVICGASMDGKRNNKTQVLEYALENLKEYSLDDMLMVGDREHDALGAKDVGIDCLGVLYGFGDRDELMEAGATYIVETVEDIKMEIL